MTKLSRFNIEQKRVVILTGDHLYLFDKNSLNRRHRVTNMNAIIKSTVSSEVVLVFPNAKDLRMLGLTTQQVTDLQSAIQLRYVNKCPTKTLFIYGVAKKSLREFSQDNRKYGFVNLPQDEDRLRDEEINGMDEVDNSAPKDDEAEMQDMFNQSIIEGGKGVGRVSISNSNDTGLDFETESTAASEDSAAKQETMKKDMRTSSCAAKKANIADIALEDFDIQM